MAEPVHHLSSLKSGDYFKFVARKAPKGLHFFVGRHSNGVPIVAPVGNRQEKPAGPRGVRRPPPLQSHLLMNLHWETATWKPSGSEVATDLGLHIDRVTSLDGTVRYAVRKPASGVLNKEGRFEYEMMPSNRDDDFYQRCRFDTLEEAQAAADVWLAAYIDFNSPRPA